jgi:ubiquinone/menaquinone biosynthesis C-methylase UbiE
MTPNSLAESAAMFRCPLSGAALSPLSAQELGAVNDAISKRALVHADGSAIAMKLRQAGLGSSDRRFVYRLEDGISWLLPALAIVRPEDAKESSQDADRRAVQTFYDDYGWAKNHAGLYNDTSDFTDVKSTSQEYSSACNARIASQLTGGRYLLDAASGPIPHESYIAFSNAYSYRVCLDFSIRALREAQKKLGDRGLYVLGDMTKLPIASGSMNDAISLHTLYHVPAAEQAAAVAELVRVVRPGGRVVIVSKWDSSPLMDWIFRLRRMLGPFKRVLSGKQRFVPVASTNSAGARLYYAPQSYQWFVANVRDAHRGRLQVWSSVSTTFQERYFADSAVGQLIARLVLNVEAALEPLAARVGEYPMFVISKR